MSKDLDFTTKNGAISRITAFSLDPFEAVIVEADPTHPLYDERAVEMPPEWFINSVIVSGAAEAIVVRNAGETKAGIVINEVVDGRKRTLASREATRRMLRVRELASKGAKPERIADEFGVDLETLDIWRTAFEEREWEPYTVTAVRTRGNAGRLRLLVSELNGHVDDSLKVKAQKYARLIENDVPEPRARIACEGISKATARNYLALVECSPATQRAVETGRVPLKVAVALSKLSAEEQAKAIADMGDVGATKGAAAIAAAKQAAKREPVTKPVREEWMFDGSGRLVRAKDPPKGAKLKTFRVWVTEEKKK